MRTSPASLSDLATFLRLFDQLYNRPRFEILRMEARLNKRTKIKQLFKKLGIDSDFTLGDLFKVSIARIVLVHYLDEIEKNARHCWTSKPQQKKGSLHQ